MGMLKVIPIVSVSKKRKGKPKRLSKFSRMTREDIKEMNEVSKRSAGLSRITYKELFGED